ncbi:hypothetical protein [Protaetiibacter intestinalis]|uniref:Uncharacterized protein n=1 Tax=Protaetiibacter intestinalis TaxID=2419774 RepID=A0A387B842_9MICO|nr:hypothetical protein [Protaetiibacter intestinalis]AYF97918.1 hypothetical protein D7I47_06355 [Protaetiibacter intestinalis]
MNAAVSRPAVSVRPGLGELAVAVGRALERWGHRHASRPLDRDALARRAEMRREADQAARTTQALVFRATGRVL